MVSWMERFRLSLGYGVVLLVLGGLFNAVCAVLLSAGFFYGAILLTLILKTGVTAVSLYLKRRFENWDAVFFYINLGLSRKRLMAATMSIDFGFLLLLEILIALCR